MINKNTSKEKTKTNNYMNRPLTSNKKNKDIKEKINKTVKPIQDGLVHGGIIKDDNLFNCCYMVQGFYSDTPHIKVSVLEANDILDFIDFKLPNISK